MNKNNLLIIFIKDAQPGRVKTRLARDLGEEKTLEFYRAMVGDILDRVDHQNNYDIRIHFWPMLAAANIQNWLGQKFHFFPQIEGDLGQKMQHAFSQGFADGYRKITLIGCDIPEISSEFINEAFAILERHDLVIGPSEDGGYYLIGLKNIYPQIFAQMPWSSEYVLDETLKTARKSALSYKLIEQIPDIDYIQDLREFTARLQNLPPDVFPRMHDFIQKEATLQGFLQNLASGKD